MKVLNLHVAPRHVVEYRLFREEAGEGIIVVMAFTERLLNSSSFERTERLLAAWLLEHPQLTVEVLFVRQVLLPAPAGVDVGRGSVRQDSRNRLLAELQDHVDRAQWKHASDTLVYAWMRWSVEAADATTTLLTPVRDLLNRLPAAPPR